MDWDIDTDSFEPAAEQPRYELVPEGEHVMTIRKAEIDDKRFKVDLSHEDRRYGFVWADFPRGVAWASKLVAELAVALGYDAASWKAASPGDLAGRRVTVRVYHKIGNSGKTFVNAGGFSPAPAEAAASAARPPAKRTPTKKADAVSAVPNDEIPF